MKNSFKIFLLTIVIGFTACTTEEKHDYSLKLWYDKPATDWQSEAYLLLFKP